MRKNLTAAFVESITAPVNGQVEYWDSKIPGFGLRVSYGGRKTWVLMYRHQGRKRRLLIGTYANSDSGLPLMTLADARDKARGELAKVQRGGDPATARQEAREADTFRELSNRYLAEYAREHKKPSSVHEDEKMLRRELTGWYPRKAADITRRDVIALVDGIAARGAAIGANRVLSLVSKVFNFGVSKEIVPTNPALRVPKPGKEHARDRALDDQEIRAVWKAFDAQPGNAADIFRILLLTGQRRSEVAEMEWRELDLKAGWWEIGKQRTKNKRPNRVPLVGRALAILKRREAERRGDGLVFPGLIIARRERNGKVREGEPIISLGRPLATITSQSAVAPFSIHDLRRTCATGLARARVPESVISKLLNHVTGNASVSRITLIYNRYEYDREKRDALLKWDALFSEILDEEGDERLLAV